MRSVHVRYAPLFITVYAFFVILSISNKHHVPVLESIENVRHDKLPGERRRNTPKNFSLVKLGANTC